MSMHNGMKTIKLNLLNYAQWVENHQIIFLNYAQRVENQQINFFKIVLLVLQRLVETHTNAEETMRCLRIKAISLLLIYQAMAVSKFSTFTHHSVFSKYKNLS
jgi:hypothetical protein